MTRAGRRSLAATAVVVLGLLLSSARPPPAEFARWREAGLSTFEERARTVFQPATGLEWQRAADAGPELPWDDAGPFCASLGTDGGGFRLPTRQELVALVDYGRFDPASRFPGMTSDGYWVSTRDRNFESGIYWAVDMRSGATPDFRESGTRYRVLCVR